MTDITVNKKPIKTYQCRDISGLTSTIKILLYIQIALAIINIISSIMQYNLILEIQRGAFASNDALTSAASANDLRQQILAVIWITAFIGTGVLILKWIYRANANVRALGAHDLKTTPGWAVGWYFIPIANLFKPFFSMKEIWQASLNPRDWQNQKGTALLGYWWALWIIAGILGRLSLQTSLRANNAEQILNATLFEILATALVIPLNLVFIRLMTQIAGMQTSHTKARDISSVSFNPATS